MANPDLPGNDALRHSRRSGLVTPEGSSLTCADGPTPSGGPARCCSGTIFPPTASSAPSPKRPSVSPSVRSACNRRSRPAPRPITRSCSPGISRIARPWCGWTAPKAREHRHRQSLLRPVSRGAWAAGRIRRRKAPPISRARTRRFVAAMREALAAAVRTPPCANLSTLVTHLLPHRRRRIPRLRRLQRSQRLLLRQLHPRLELRNLHAAPLPISRPLAAQAPPSAFPKDDQGAMRFRQLLPDGVERFGFAAADGQMGQIVQAYLDWSLSGDTDWLRRPVAPHQERTRIRLGSRRLGRR